MKKCISMVLAAIMLLYLIPTTVFASTIMMVDVENIDLPVAGAKPDLSAQLGSLSGVMKITLVEWSEYDEGWEWQKDMAANDTFKEGYWYVVYVHLETNPGHNFSNSVTGAINNTNAKMVGNATQANGTKVGFYAAYQATKMMNAIGKVDLTVVRPFVGKTPTFAKVDTAQYFSEKYGTVSNCSNGVTWTNQSSGVNLSVSNPFKEGVKYMVTYYLTAKEGYKFTSATTCTINGSAANISITDATHAKVSIGDILPDDGKKEISTLELTVVAPKDGEKPTYTKIDDTGYYSDNGLNGTTTKIYKNGIAWYKSASSYIGPGTTETFKGGSEYIAKVSLTPKDGYKFAKNVTAKINGKTATVEKFDDGSVSVSVKFTALNNEHTHIASSTWQYDDTEHWKICSDKNCNALVGEKQMHSNSDPDGKCDICGYQLPIEVPEIEATPGGATINPTQKPTEKPTQKPTESTSTPTVETTEPTATPTAEENSEQTDNAGKNNGALLWVIIGVVIVIVAGAVIAIVIMKRRKNL